MYDSLERGLKLCVQFRIRDTRLSGDFTLLYDIVFYIETTMYFVCSDVENVRTYI